MAAAKVAQGTQFASEVVLPNGRPKVSPSRVSVQPTTTPMPALPLSRPLPSQSARRSSSPDRASREQPTAGPSTPQRPRQLQASSQRERGPAVDEGVAAGEERSEAPSSLHHANEECDFNIFTGEPRKHWLFFTGGRFPSVFGPQSFVFAPFRANCTRQSHVALRSLAWRCRGNTSQPDDAQHAHVVSCSSQGPWTCALFCPKLTSSPLSLTFQCHVQLAGQPATAPDARDEDVSLFVGGVYHQRPERVGQQPLAWPR
jgi:hypothetical protein